MSVEAEQRRIEQRIEGQTLNELFMDVAARNGPKPALVAKDGDRWRTTTWAGYRDRATEAAMGLRSLGVDHRDFVAIMAGNRPEHVIADVGAMLAGATPVSVYNTLAPDQVGYVAGNCGAKVAILEHGEYLEKWQSVRDELPELEHIVVIDDEGVADEGAVAGVLSWRDLLERGAHALETDPGEFDAAWKAVDPADVATIIYTSGTTGPPKGVQLTHHNVMFQLSALNELVAVPDGLRNVSYLPLAHIAERMTTHYRAIQNAGTVYFAPEVTAVAETLLEARPHFFMAVPRVWEKFHAALMAGIEGEENDARRKLALKAIEVGKEVVRARQRGEEPGLVLKAQHALFDRLVYSKIRERVGLDECMYQVAGAAPINHDLLLFFAGIGLEILEVYGMTESTAVISGNRPGEIKIGTVGPPLPGTEVKIAEDGEVLARGPHVTPGYLGREEATQRAIDDEGWLHTGDLGELDEDGYLSIIGRKKELIVTSSGKNLSPNNIEETIKQKSPIIGQICAIGDDRNFISALIVLDEEAAPAWAESHGIQAGSLAELAQHPDVEAEIQRAVDAGNAELARIEQVKKFEILESEWTAESEELTPTLKLKRNVIHSKYSDVIDSMYG